MKVQKGIQNYGTMESLDHALDCRVDLNQLAASDDVVVDTLEQRTETLYAMSKAKFQDLDKSSNLNLKIGVALFTLGAASFAADAFYTKEINPRSWGAFVWGAFYLGKSLKIDRSDFSSQIGIRTDDRIETLYALTIAEYQKLISASNMHLKFGAAFCGIGLMSFAADAIFAEKINPYSWVSFIWGTFHMGTSLKSEKSDLKEIKIRVTGR